MHVLLGAVSHLGSIVNYLSSRPIFVTFCREASRYLVDNLAIRRRCHEIRKPTQMLSLCSGIFWDPLICSLLPYSLSAPVLMPLIRCSDLLSSSLLPSSTLLCSALPAAAHKSIMKTMLHAETLKQQTESPLCRCGNAH